MKQRPKSDNLLVSLALLSLLFLVLLLIWVGAKQQGTIRKLEVAAYEFPKQIVMGAENNTTKVTVWLRCKAGDGGGQYTVALLARDQAFQSYSCDSSTDK